MTQTHATYTTPTASFADDKGHTVTFGPSRIVVEPLDSPHKCKAERIADRIGKSFILVAALYLVAEIFRAFAAGPLVVVSR